MNLQLEGKTAVVTRSTAGIGLAIATALAREGAAVIVNGRTQERVDRAVRISGAAHGVAADLGTEAGVSAVIERFPAVDILINNLGIFEPKPFEQISDDDWRRLLRGERTERSPVEPSLYRPYEAKELGAHHFHFERVRPADSRRDDSLRHDQDCPTGDISRAG